MGRIHAVLSDGTVVTDVEVCPIFYLFLFSVVVYLLCALSHYMFSFLSKFESSIASPSCIFLCVCMCACCPCEYEPICVSDSPNTGKI